MMQKNKLKGTEVDHTTFTEEMQGSELTLDPVETVRLYGLSESIDWMTLEEEIVPILGAHSGPIVRLVCGAIFLKSFYELSSAEIIAKWPYCPEFRHFCGGDIVENAMLFPISLDVLDTLESRLDGKGCDAMIQALLATSDSGDNELDARILH